MVSGFRDKKEAEDMRRKKKRGNGILLFFMIISVSLIVVLVCMLLLKLRDSRKEPVYVSVSMSEEAAARAYVWLNQIEDMPLSYTEIKEMMGDIRLELVLTPAGEKGKYTQALAEDTFADCQEKAQNGLEKAYREVARYRFLAAGKEEEISDDMLDDMMQEAYGVSVSEYLSFCDVQLMPTLEELTEMYSGEVTNEYGQKNNSLFVDFRIDDTGDSPLYAGSQ